MMRHCKEDSATLFERLTAEEQLDDIREYVDEEKEWFDSTRLDHLMWMLFRDSCSKTSLINEVARMSHIFCCETSKHVLNDTQKDELARFGSTIVVVPHAWDNVFTFWARSEGFYYRQVIEHSTVDAYEYLIWRNKDE